MKSAQSKTWNLPLSWNGRRYSDISNAPLPPSGGGNDLYDALYSAFFAQNTGDRIYVATTGSDSTGDGSEGNPFASIGHAINAMSAGDVVVVDDGVYTGVANWISVVQASIPNGISRSQFTTIKAKNPFGVTITQPSDATVYGDSPLNLGSCQYVHVDGIQFVNTATASTNTEQLINLGDATNCCVSRYTATRTVVGTGGLADYGNYNLLQDGAIFGSARYGLYGGSGGVLGVAAGNSIVRRCVAYIQWGRGLLPSASLAFYGSNDPSEASCKDVAFLNFFEFDSPWWPDVDGDTPNTQYGQKWGGCYLPKSSRNIVFRGCGFFNGGAQYGAISLDNVTSGAIADIADVAVVGYANSSAGGQCAAFRKASQGTAVLSNYTVSNVPGGATAGSGWTASNGLTTGAVNPCQRVSGNGAEILYSVGKFMSFWGDTGYLDVQDGTSGKNLEPLWPYPYQDEIKVAMNTTLSRPANHYPASIASTTNPFSGSSIGGGAMSITHRVWESIGNEIPNLNEVYA